MPHWDRDSVQQAGENLLERISRVMDGADWPAFLQLADMLPKAKRTFVTGAGRSGLVARSFGMRLMHAGLTTFIPGETITPAADEGDLVIAISCTGDTGITEYIARRGKQLGAKIVVLTSNPDSELGKLADHLVILPARADDIVIRAAVFEHAASLCLDAVFNVLAERLKLDVESYRRRHANLE